MASVKLTIRSVGNNQHEVIVSGEGFFNAPVNARVGIRIKGDDPVFDETLFSTGQFTRVVDGVFVATQIVDKSKLNEDWGEDEIYALADVDGYPTIQSNVVKGRY